MGVRGKKGAMFEDRNGGLKMATIVKNRGKTVSTEHLVSRDKRKSLDASIFSSALHAVVYVNKMNGI